MIAKGNLIKKILLVDKIFPTDISNKLTPTGIPPNNINRIKATKIKSKIKYILFFRMYQ